MPWTLPHSQAARGPGRSTWTPEQSPTVDVGCLRAGGPLGACSPAFQAMQAMDGSPQAQPLRGASWTQWELS